MNFIETEIKGLWIIEPKVFEDARGYFMEVYKKEVFDQHIGKIDFIQDNESKSSFGVLRGLHYQEGETSQAKLVRVIEGSVLDVAVDIRKNSPTFGQYKMVELTAENKKQFFISRGFAHGFLVLSETAVFTYKVDNRYSPSTERTINCLDPDLNIPWPLDASQLLLSEKDKSGKFLKEIHV
ncbi:dTDP-4-dehydrorhamnose 3,5-epimerase [Bacteroidia bacterium]|nr:dTDP-4-dehydrorhamnose 3,5-epimerase [Bacteroidia bacterium]GHT48137.1 dTDP-4-dehydrorhamnose 3,5-epimerase [Bacteroidia bacterium]